MKKLVLIGSIAVSSLMASGLCLNATLSPKDTKADLEFKGDSSRCFNAYDFFSITPPVSISTKTAGEDFQLKIYKKPYCNVSNVRYYLVDNNTGTKIDGTEGVLANVEWSIITLNVPNSHKDVSVKFEYDKINYNSTPTEVSCPANPASLPKTPTTTGIWATPTTTAPYFKCYQYGSTLSSKSDLSTDNFAIKPEKFDITFNTSPIKAGANTFATIKTLNSNGNITTNYNNSSINLDISSNVQYSFEVKNGITKNAQFIFLKPGSQTLTITDSHFTDVDSDDTVESCRIFSGSKSTNVLATSKSWAGTGTNENENNPTKNTLGADVKQNTKKDLHYQKMTW